MQVIENSKVKEKLYIKKLENGLTIMVIPKKNMQKQYIIYGTNYGSIDNKFIVPGEDKPTEVPDGVAHFLEHKMFEQENGTNSLDVLTALGVSANAFTTTDITAYLYESAENFYPALDELMNYIQHPYFTDENVEKEKGIIGQEIMMYDDYPEWKVYMNVLSALYNDNPVRIDTAGTKESIAKINKDILYKCYNTFYHPSNMAVVVCGAFGPNKVREEIEKRLIKKDNQGEIKRIYPEEKKEIPKQYIEAKMEISTPLFVIGLKDNEINSKDIIKKHIAMEIILSVLIGKSSKLYEKLYKEGLILAEPDSSYEFSRNYAYAVIQGQSKEPKKVLEYFKQEIEDLKKNGILKEDFDRTRKMIYGDYIKEYNSVSDIATMFLTDYLKGINSFDYLEEYSSVTLEYVEQVLKEVFKPEYIVLSVVTN